MTAIAEQQRHIGLFAATGVGVGAIVGGGILALAGVAFEATGPSAIVAFGINGLIALLTALSFAEMASKFPESGGTYVFSRKVLSVEAAFTVGWVVWFASIVAAMLYAVGFGFFFLVLIHDLLAVAGYELPDWSSDDRKVAAVALGATCLLSIGLMLRSAGGGQWANVAKVAVFAVLILAGFWALSRQPLVETRQSLHPFFAAGTIGLFQAMGYSFIALQGFDLIAAVGGEIRDPAKTIPCAIILSLTIAMCIYLPLLFIITTVGTPDGRSIVEVAAEDPEAIVAIAADRFLGRTGYWFVIAAAVLSMFTALQANLFAASRIALAMSRDHTLPSLLGKVHARRQTPIHAIWVTSALVVLLVIMLPDVSAAGAAASLIFLITFAIAHWLSMLVRLRSGLSPPPFRSPFFPAVPIVGGVACIALAVFQGIVVPSAGTITIVWLSIGGLLFLTMFARRARLKDVSSVAADPELVRLRGSTPLVLVPIANPRNAGAMISLADTLVPAEAGRVLLQTIVVAATDWDPDAQPEPVDRSQALLRELLRASTRLGVRVETLTTVSSQPMEEIARVAQLHRCESVLLGFSDVSGDNGGTPLEGLLGKLSSDVVVLRATNDWNLAETQKILVPVGGRGGHDYLLARLLGSLSRKQKHHVTFLRVVPPTTPSRELRRIRRELDRIARDNVTGRCERQVILRDDPVSAITELADESSLVILGIQRIGPHQKLFGRFTRQVAQQTRCPIIVISRRG